ncbi:preprotein translocase subunit YajC [Paenibacillus yanchengensis]|uniref:Preprotein translocase subunit YajC n=1 Tax=Paenibacillus yanchengensis TaxID=2035833 RepID=A0ABW4YL93_9BACL
MSQWLEAADPAAGGGIWGLILPFIIMFAVFYFLLIRPQQKKQKQRNMMLAQIKKGDKITTIGGLHGSVAELTDDTVVVRVNDTTRMTFERSAINAIIESAPGSAE